MNDYEATKKKPMTIEEMEKRWPVCPPNKAMIVEFISSRGRSKDFDLTQDTIKEIREYLDAVEECVNG